MAFDDLRRIILHYFKYAVQSIRKSRAELMALLGIDYDTFDCCKDGCMAFTRNHYLLRKCTYCGSARFVEDPGNEGSIFYSNPREFREFTPRAVFQYLPLIPRLKLLYAHRELAAKMRYPKDLEEDPWDDGIRDVWDGSVLKDLRNKGQFPSFIERC